MPSPWIHPAPGSQIQFKKPLFSIAHCLKSFPSQWIKSTYNWKWGPMKTVVTLGFPLASRIKFSSSDLQIILKAAPSHWISTLSPNKPHPQPWEQPSLYPGVLLYSSVVLPASFSCQTIILPPFNQILPSCPKLWFLCLIMHQKHLGNF